MFGKKKETLEERLERERKTLLEYFNSETGKRVFEAAIKVAEKEKGDKKACPLLGRCSVWFAKSHDKYFPNFFINPCWEMSNHCMCPLRKDGCDNCQRKKDNNPLC